MGTVDKLKERLEHKEYIGKACPICGAAPKLVSVDLGRPGGHGYPGCVDMHLECSGCGILKAGSYDTIYNKYDEAKNKATQDWNEVVDYVNELSTKTRKEKATSSTIKIYIVVDACSGEDYSADDPTILFVSSNYEEARAFFNAEISNWEDGMEDYESNVEEYVEGPIYECTDFGGDSHRIMKIVTREIGGN